MPTPACLSRVSEVSGAEVDRSSLDFCASGTTASLEVADTFLSFFSLLSPLLTAEQGFGVSEPSTKSTTSTGKTDPSTSRAATDHRFLEAVKRETVNGRLSFAPLFTRMLVSKARLCSDSRIAVCNSLIIVGESSRSN